MHESPADPGSYPAPRIPLFPVLSSRTFGASGPGAPSVLDSKWVLPLTYGRMAIALALRELGVTPGDRVLLPSYHCLSMVDPVLHAGAEPVFYRLHRDGSVNLDDVRSRIGPRTRALVVVHYFGFPQDMEAVCALCADSRLPLIEDCAHAMFGSFRGSALGSFGDYAVASPMKFYPILDGGLLTSARRPLDGIRLTGLGPLFSLRASTILIERSLEYRRLRVAGLLLAVPLWLKSAAVAVVKRLTPGARDRWGPSVGERSSGETGDFDPRWVDRRMSWTSRVVMRRSSRSRIVDLRRRHYAYLLDRLSGLRGAHPLRPELPEGVVPYLFPLVVEDPARVFPRLKRKGVPITRFGEFLSERVSFEEHAEAAALSRTVLQFPCHQELEPEELAWMADTIRAVLLEEEREGGTVEPAVQGGRSS
ncbi:MAG TPA: DegT/DnrJ/EryC1/StrS family aminotransferase [Candidatus Eisenbacteria bacterium]|nr:DegT/DnrJ/EryC1/StrS family aminotransferase [Candidatus Eisenbacteria bacterium]